MKNKAIEHRIRQAKHYAKTWGHQHRLNAQGNYIVHDYDTPRLLSWWIDVSFKLGSQIISLSWIHPRQYYQDLCEEFIDHQMPPLDIPAKDILPIQTINYKKLGKNGNRKKVVSYTMGEFHPEFLARAEQKRTALDTLLTTSDITAKPFIQIKQLNWCRSVHLCVPIEVLSEDDANRLVDIAKQLITRQTTLDELYPDYEYNKNHWIQEQPLIAQDQALRTQNKECL